jgi:hypothetical protein
MPALQARGERVLVRGLACALVALLFGAAGAGLGYFVTWPELRPLLRFAPTTATITHAEITLRPGSGRIHVPELRFRYPVAAGDAAAGAAAVLEGGRYRMVETGLDADGARAILARHAPGSRHPAWYDPASPADAVLHRGIGFGSVVGILCWVAAVLVPAWLWRASRPPR